MLLSFLNKPYPFTRSLQKSAIGNLFIGLFVALFLISFQPFGINEWITPNKILKLAGFGFISFLAPTIINWLTVSLLPAKAHEEWTISKEIVSILIVLSLIALGNLFYGRMLGIIPITLKGYLIALVVTCVIGVFPITIHVIRKHNRLLKINLEKTIELNKQLAHNSVPNPETPGSPEQKEISQNNKITLIAENEKDTVNLLPSQLLFIESADNYSNIVFLENSARKKQLIRSSLKRIENQLMYPKIVRCHRTYIVNLDKIKKVEGNAAGYKLFFHETDDVIPVSRNFIPVINELLKEN